jgi:hypothetical protein
MRRRGTEREGRKAAKERSSVPVRTSSDPSPCVPCSPLPPAAVPFRQRSPTGDLFDSPPSPGGSSAEAALEVAEGAKLHGEEEDSELSDIDDDEEDGKDEEDEEEDEDEAPTGLVPRRGKKPLFPTTKLWTKAANEALQRGEFPFLFFLPSPPC